MSLIGKIIGLRTPEEKRAYKQQQAQKEQAEEIARDKAMDEHNLQQIENAKKAVEKEEKARLAEKQFETEYFNVYGITPTEEKYRLRVAEQEWKQQSKIISDKLSDPTLTNEQYYLLLEETRNNFISSNGFKYQDILRKKQELLNKQIDIKSDEADINLKKGSMSEEDKLDKQISIAQKKKELLKLQKEIKDLEGDDPIEE